MKNASAESGLISAIRKSQKILMARYVFLSFMLPFLMIACDKIDQFSRPHVATVNDSKIYLEDFQARLNKKKQMLTEDFLNHPEYMKKFEAEVLEGMITEKIMQLRARELNISVSEDELEKKINEIREDYGEDFTGLFTRQNMNYDQWKAEFREEMLIRKLIALDVNAKIKITEDEIRDYYNQNTRRYKKDSRVRVAQIVVRDMAGAKKAMARLKSGEKFEKVAADMSIGPEARHGGDLGFITRRMMPDPLDKTIFQMPVHQISPIVQSSYGFHIFKVLESQPAREGTLADVRQEVMDDIRMQKEEAAFAVWLEELKSKAVIKKETDIKVIKNQSVK
ncbi:MAG: peptidyl-prolyl cis-trans isomerase [Smithella sp.]